MNTAEWALAAALFDAVWCIALISGLYVLERNVTELRVWIAVSLQTQEADSGQGQQPLRAGSPDIGTPPLIPPPIDAESATNGRPRGS